MCLTTFPRLATGTVLLAAALCLLPQLTKAQPGSAAHWLKGGHAGTINAVVFSPDGTLVASASDDATVKLWSTNGTLLRTIGTHPYQATALAFSPDGDKLAAGVYSGGYQSVSSQPIGGRGRVLTWQSLEGWTNDSVTLLRTSTNHLAKITSLAFSLDGSKLASSGAEGSNVVQSISDGSVLTRKAAFNTSQGPSISWDIAFSSGGLLASACEDGTLLVWNSSWSQVWSTNGAHASDVTAVEFSPDGGRLVTAGTDAKIRVWSTSSWSCLQTLTNHTDDVMALAFAPDGNALASASMDHTIKLWEMDSGDCLGTLVGHSDGVTAVEYSPDGNSIVSGALDNSVRLWSAEDGSLIQYFTAHMDTVKAAAVSPDGTLCATISNDESVQVRRLLDGALVRVIPGHTGCVSAVAFAPSSEVLATAGGPLEPSIKLWNLSDGSVLRTIPATSDGVTAMAFSADGSVLASGGDADDCVIQLWDANTGDWVRTLAGHSNGVTALAFSPQGELLVSGGRGSDNIVKVWPVAGGDPLQTFSGHDGAVDAVAFSPDGSRVASGSSGTNVLRVHELSDGSSRTMGTDTHCVFFVAFSPDGSTLASACHNTIKLWDVATGNLSQTITQEMTRASCLAYSPNGNLMLCGREDGTVLVLDNVIGALGREPLTFTSIAVGINGAGNLEAAVQPQVHYVIEASTNLADWSFLTLAVSETNTLPIIDSETNKVARRFYRALTPP